MAKTKTVQMTWLELARRRAGHSRKEAAAFTRLSVRSWERWEQSRNEPMGALRDRIEEQYPMLVPCPEVTDIVCVNPETLEVVL